MRKFFKISKLVSSVLMCSLLITGCGPLSDADEVVLDLDGTIFGDMDKREENEEETKKDELIVAFMFDGEINDGGYSQMHDQGRQKVEKIEGVKTIYKEGVLDDEKQVEEVCEEFIKNGAKVIYGTSFGHMDGMYNEAEKHKDVTFIHCSGYKTLDNMSNFFGKIYQMRYLTGIAAGSVTKSNKIGYVAAFPIPEVIRGINAFTLGVQKVNPDAVVEVLWTSTWNDYELEKSTAEKLIDNGADVIAQHQNTTGPQAAAKERNIYSVGYNRDMSYENDKQITAAIWDWGIYYTECTKRILDGKWKTGSEWLDASSGLVDIAPVSDYVSPEIKNLIEEEKVKILNGDDKIFTGPIYNQKNELVVEEGKKLSDEELSSMAWFIKGVDGKLE